jgi:hypothetical protein
MFYNPEVLSFLIKSLIKYTVISNCHLNLNKTINSKCSILHLSYLTLELFPSQYHMWKCVLEISNDRYYARM